MKKIFLFFYFAFLFSLSFVSGIAVHPYNLNFEAIQGQEICKNISIENSGTLVFLDRWEKEGKASKELSNYLLSKEELGISLNYDLLNINSNSNLVSLCISGKKYGNYNGVLLIRENSSLSGIGVWINVSIEKGNYLSSIMTGSSVKNIEKTDTKLFFYFSTTLLLGVFIFCLIKIKKIKDLKFNK